MSDVCHHSGVTPDQCPHSHDGVCMFDDNRNRMCVFTLIKSPCPDEIVRRAAAIRADWTEEGEMSRRGIYQTEVYMPYVVYVVTDHMRREKLPSE